MDEFEARVRTLGMKLLMAKLRFYGSELKLHMALTRPWWETVRSGVNIINDILFVRVLEQMNPKFANRPHADRKFFIFTPFWKEMKRIYSFRNCASDEKAVGISFHSF